MIRRTLPLVVIALAGLLLSANPAGATAARISRKATTTKACTWVALGGRMELCGGALRFSPSGAFDSPASKVAFERFGRRAAPTVAWMDPHTGVLRWKGGTCSFERTRRAAVLLTCGSEIAMRPHIEALADTVDPDEPREVLCTNRRTGATDVVGAGPLGAAYPDEACKLLGRGWAADPVPGA